MTRREFLAASAAVAAIPAVAEALPTPTVKGLTFEEARAQSGRYIQRVGWGQKHIVFYQNDPRLSVLEVRRSFMRPAQEALRKEDKAATDWRLIGPGDWTLVATTKI